MSWNLKKKATDWLQRDHMTHQHMYLSQWAWPELNVTKDNAQNVNKRQENLPWNGKNFHVLVKYLLVDRVKLYNHMIIWTQKRVQHSLQRQGPIRSVLLSSAEEAVKIWKKCSKPDFEVKVNPTTNDEWGICHQGPEMNWRKITKQLEQYQCLGSCQLTLQTDPCSVQFCHSSSTSAT